MNCSLPAALVMNSAFVIFICVKLFRPPRAEPFENLYLKIDYGRFEHVVDIGYGNKTDIVAYALRHFVDILLVVLGDYYVVNAYATGGESLFF